MIMKENLEKIPPSVFFVYFLKQLIFERLGVYLSGFCNVPILVGTWCEWIESIKFQLISRICRDGLTKKSSKTACVKSTKMGAYATSFLKSDNEREPRKNTSFSLLCLVFANYWLLKGKMYLSGFVMFHY